MSGVPASATLVSLVEQRDFLLASLRDIDLEERAGDLSAEDARALREDYTVRAAAVLRALERMSAPGSTASGFVPSSNRADPAPVGAGSATLPPGPSAPAGPSAGSKPRRRSRLVTVLAVIGVAAFAGAAGVVVARTSGERVSGQPVSGTLPGDGGANAGALARAQRLFSQGRLLEAIKAYDALLRADPSNVAALTSRGWMLRLVGVQAKRPELVDRGLASLDQAVAADPSYPDAHLFRGILLFRDHHDPEAAVPELQRWLASNPPRDRVPDVERVLAEAQAASAGSTTSTSQ